MNRAASDILRNALGRNAEKLIRGYSPTTRRSSGYRTMASVVLDPLKIPLVEYSGSLQNASGEFLVMPGYSALDGPDVLA